MAEGRSVAAWNHTASAMALLANCHRDPKRHRAFRPMDFHPHRRHLERCVTVASLTNEIIKIAEGKKRLQSGAKRKRLLVPYKPPKDSVGQTA